MHNIKKIFTYISFIILVIHCYVYNSLAEDMNNIYTLEEITITGTRIERDTFGTPIAISVVTPNEINSYGLQTTADLLREEAGVQVQKTTAGQGSPIIRGLTGYQTLILIDGIRLNNSTFRSGPNQYMSTIDSGQLERIEVVRGYGSVLYGSSAMGGVINVLTKSPASSISGLSVHPSIFSKFSSADKGKYARLEINGGYKNFSFIAGASYKDVDDLKPGKGYDIQLPSKKLLITSQEEPKNIPQGAWLVDKLVPTGWQERNGDVKLGYKISENQNIKLAYQGVRQQDVPRYDKLGNKEFDTFLFDPQNRDLVYINYTNKYISNFLDSMQISLSYHKQEEGQKQQKAKSTSFKEITDITKSKGLSMQFDSSIGKMQKLTYGLEFYHDNVDSKSITTNLKDGKKKVSEWGTFPNDSIYWDTNVYVQDSLKLLNNLELIVAGRYTQYATRSDLSIGDPTFGIFEDSGNAIIGNIGAVLGITKSLNLTFNAGQAFRAPNLNDTTAVAVTNEGIDAPSLDLEPEQSNGIDIGLKKRSKYFSGTINYYFNRVKGLMMRVPLEKVYPNNEEMPKLYKEIQESYEGIPIFVKDNIGKANIQGIELAINWLIIPSLPYISAYGNLDFTRGKDLSNNQPIRREQPVNGLIGIRWENKDGKFWAEIYSRFAGKQDRLSDGDIRDPRIPGTTTDPKIYDPMAYSPGWYTLNIRVGFNLRNLTRLIVGVENINNRRYREHGSGVDAPGINFIANLSQKI